MALALCDCGKKATWRYTPGYSSGSNSNHCDECVPRGCMCNYQYVEDDSYIKPMDSLDMPCGEEGKDFIWVDERTWCELDDKGRPYPCAEYDYEEDGFEND